ncbi:alpha-ketoacid dehydrogenase subunit beta [Microbispora sp. ATCC PTA-5024]|uniref:alpha-ketoacid dehydrogenase subunit beta n=1 Tax=Microbispora sp. ATCC PTA-5024 TaxID=316330 RepID=UPI0003DC1458|nr:transketolase C-terminal domain-containing protein [Microbispora sp. ATCC PTA-5024]ETK35821.1 pyruvate dehydrogenase [Microbispora sp. ATCC PTA-5024]
MRVAENLNAALHAVLEADPSAYVIGEDITDPYGGAFKITKGLSSRFPDRVLGTPISESGITGLAAGLALCGDAAIVEIMFGDFVALAFDQIVNFAAKSVSMYGSHVPMRMVVRCPSGGGRGYGPTHSQSLQKHFVGVPGLSVYEMSPLHDNRVVLEEMLAAGRPSVFFEDKVLYTRRMHDVGDLFLHDHLAGSGGAASAARVFLEDPEAADCVIIAPGGMVERAVGAMRRLLLEQEVSCTLVVPSRLHPFDVEPLLPSLRRARAVLVAEESTAGGTWGSEVAHRIHALLWRDLRRPVTLVHSADSVIPTALHLERSVLVQESTIHDAVLEALRD